MLFDFTDLPDIEEQSDYNSDANDVEDFDVTPNPG